MTVMEGLQEKGLHLPRRCSQGQTKSWAATCAKHSVFRSKKWGKVVHLQGVELLGKMCGFQDTQCACHALLSLPAWSEGLRPSFAEKGHLLTVGGEGERRNRPHPPS